MTRRLEAMGQKNYAGLTTAKHFNGKIRTLPDRLLAPLSWKKPARVFVNSMSDLFHEGVPDEFIDQVFAIMALCPQHTFQILTKRPARMMEYFQKLMCRRQWRAGKEDVDQETGAIISWLAAFSEEHRGPDFGRQTAEAMSQGWPLPNVWLGTSIEDQATADARIPHLLKTPAAVRFLSYEPALGPVDIREFLYRKMLQRIGAEMQTINWVICGGESGPGARPMHPDWARSVRDQCQAAGVAFFFKQWGGFFCARMLHSHAEWVNKAATNSQPGDMFIDSLGNGLFSGKDFQTAAWPVAIMRPGRKGSNGRILDKREWMEYPAAAVPQNS